MGKMSKETDIIDEELREIISVFGISMAGKYKCRGAVEFAKVLRNRFANQESSEVEK